MIFFSVLFLTIHTASFSSYFQKFIDDLNNFFHKKFTIIQN